MSDEDNRKINELEVSENVKIAIKVFLSKKTGESGFFNTEHAPPALRPIRYKPARTPLKLVTKVPLFSGDGGSGVEPTITAASYDQPTELGGADTHLTAYLFASTAGDSNNIRPHHLGKFTCVAGQELMLFNVYQGTKVHTHRTGLRSIANVDTYLRGLTPDASKGYGSIYYANAGGETYSPHTNLYYVIAVTPLSGGGGGQ